MDRYFEVELRLVVRKSLDIFAQLLIPRRPFEDLDQEPFATVRVARVSALFNVFGYRVDEALEASTDRHALCNVRGTYAL